MSKIFFEDVLAHQYTVFDGLGGMHVEDIYQDRQGFLWAPRPTAASVVLIVRGSIALECWKIGDWRLG